MRVALVNNFFPPRASGSAHLTEGLARKLAAQGVDVLVVTAAFEGARGDEKRDGYRIVRLPSWSVPKSALTMRFDVNFAFSPRNYRRLAATLDDFAPDVLHQHGQFFDLTFMTSAFAARRRLPTVLSVHTRLEHTSAIHNLILALGDRTLVRAFISRSKPDVVTMDRLMHDYVMDRYGIPEDRLAPIPVGVEPARFGHAGNAVRERLGLGERPIVLSLGHVIPVRDRLALVEAMPRLVAHRPDVAVVVVGIVYDDRFLRRAEELGVADHLVLTGGVPKDEVPDYLAAATVESHDLQGYGLGTASLEMMAAGVPVVASVRDDNFIGFRLRSWQDLVLVPPDDPTALADALARLIDDPSLAETLGTGGRRLVEDHFSLDVVTRQHLELYERVIARPKR
ncbi:MAG: glycosyltransferase family 4 protein [Actinomycetota bacterium]